MGKTHVASAAHARLVCEVAVRIGNRDTGDGGERGDGSEAATLRAVPRRLAEVLRALFGATAAPTEEIGVDADAGVVLVAASGFAGARQVRAASAMVAHANRHTVCCHVRTVRPLRK